MNKKKICLLTGASSNLGLEIINYLTNRNYKIIGLTRDSKKLDFTSNKMNDDLDIESFDLSGEISKLPEFMTYLLNKYGEINSFIHAAGCLNFLPIRQFNYQQSIQEFNVNFFSIPIIIKSLLSKKNNSTNINAVLISSIAANKGNPGYSNYAASKASISNFVQSASKELSADKLRINAILPGIFRSKMSDYLSDNSPFDFFEFISNSNATGEVMQGKDLVPLIYFLLSSDSKFINGQNIVIDGGSKTFY